MTQCQGPCQPGPVLECSHFRITQQKPVVQCRTSHSSGGAGAIRCALLGALRYGRSNSTAGGHCRQPLTRCTCCVKQKLFLNTLQVHCTSFSSQSGQQQLSAIISTTLCQTDRQPSGSQQWACMHHQQQDSTAWCERGGLDCQVLKTAWPGALQLANQPSVPQP